LTITNEFKTKIVRNQNKITSAVVSNGRHGKWFQ